LEVQASRDPKRSQQIRHPTKTNMKLNHHVLSVILDLQ